MIISTFSFTIMTAFVKYLNHLPAFELVFFRSFGSFILASSYLARKKISVLGKSRKLLILRGLFGLSSMALFFMSLKLLPLGSAVTLRYVSPFFATAFAIYFLKDRVRPLQWLFFAISFGGVFILKGFDGQINTIGLLYVMGASASSGLVYVIIGKIGRTDHPVVIVNYFMFTATLVGGAISLFNWIQPKDIEWLVLVSLGFFGYLGQLFMTKAFQLGDTNQVAPLKYVEVVFTIFVGIVWLKEDYTYWSFIGIFLIIGGLLLNAKYKR